MPPTIQPHPIGIPPAPQAPNGKKMVGGPKERGEYIFGRGPKDEKDYSHFCPIHQRQEGQCPAVSGEINPPTYLREARFRIQWDKSPYLLSWPIATESIPTLDTLLRDFAFHTLIGAGEIKPEQDRVLRAVRGLIEVYLDNPDRTTAQHRAFEAVRWSGVHVKRDPLTFSKSSSPWVDNIMREWNPKRLVYYYSKPAQLGR